MISRKGKYEKIQSVTGKEVTPRRSAYFCPNCVGKSMKYLWERIQTESGRTWIIVGAHCYFCGLMKSIDDLEAIEIEKLSKSQEGEKEHPKFPDM